MALDARTLLRRLDDSTASELSSSASLREAILDHIRLICTTRKGTMLTRPDFGLPDLGELLSAVPAAIPDLVKALEHSILTYEPRIARVTVRPLDADAVLRILRFEIGVTLKAGAAEEGMLNFETSIDLGRHLVVR